MRSSVPSRALRSDQLPPRTARGVPRRARGSRPRRGHAHRRGQVALLPASRAAARRPHGRRLTAHRPDEGPGGRAARPRHRGRGAALGHAGPGAAGGGGRARGGSSQADLCRPRAVGPRRLPRGAGAGGAGPSRGGRGALHQPMGARFQAGLPAARPASARSWASRRRRSPPPPRRRCGPTSPISWACATPLELVTGFERPNLTLSVERCRGREDKREALERLIREIGLPGHRLRRHPEVGGPLERYPRAAWACAPGAIMPAWPTRSASGRRTISSTGRVDASWPPTPSAWAWTRPTSGSWPTRSCRAASRPTTRKWAGPVATACPRGARCCSPPPTCAPRNSSWRAPIPPRAPFARCGGSSARGSSDGTRSKSSPAATGASGMAAATAARLLRRAAESAGCRPGQRSAADRHGGRGLKARRDRERLDTMVRYAFSRGCRTRFVYDYFAGGARGGAAPRCGVCDVCLGWRRGAGRVLDDDELLQVRIALSGVGRLSGRFGVERVAQVLVGQQGARGARPRSRPHSHLRQALRAVALDRVKDLLGVLADAGLVERRGIEGGRPARSCWRSPPKAGQWPVGEVRPELDLPGSRRASSAQAHAGRRPSSEARVEADADPELLARLKAWRTEEARRRSLPPYVIFHDRTLAAVAAAQPAGQDDLATDQGHRAGQAGRLRRGAAAHEASRA